MNILSGKTNPSFDSQGPVEVISLPSPGPSMPPRRARPPPSPVFRHRLLFLTLLSPLFLISFLHIFSVALHHANDLGRRCQGDPPGFAPSGSMATQTLRISMVSFSKEGGGGGEGRSPRRRSFRGVTAVVGRSKRTYAARMGYHFVDAGGIVDHSRPPSWSKIPAVRSQLPSHDWVFWNDADTVVTNPDISLENILRAINGQDDFMNSSNLVMTEDINGINAGVFFVRRSKWSENFLDTWWNQSSFVQFGSTKSGDNDALKYLIKNLPSNELREHVRISPMQCLFNSYPWYPSWKSFYQLISSPGAVWRGAYSRGDFMVHLAGLDDKKEWAERILQELEDEKRDFLYQARQRPFL